MRTRFRYAALLLALTAGTAVTAVSCSPDATAPVTTATPRVSAQTVDQLKQSYGWMGEYHTKALVAVHAKLSEKKNRGLGKMEKCRLATAALKEFHKAFRRNGRPLGFTDVSVVDGMCDAAASADLRVAGSLIAAPLRPLRSELSGAAANQMRQIEQAFDADVSRSALEATISSIQSSAAGSLPADEAGAVVGLGSIAHSSIAYWDENLGSWGGDGPGLEDAYSRLAPDALSRSVNVGTLTPRFGLSPRGRAIMKADISAALSTLIYEWFLGVIALEKAAIRGASASIIAGLLY